MTNWYATIQVYGCLRAKETYVQYVHAQELLITWSETVFGQQYAKAQPGGGAEGAQAPPP